MPTVTENPSNVWRARGYADGSAGKRQRTPLRDDDGAAMRAYLAGYRAAMREKGKPVS